MPIMSKQYNNDVFKKKEVLYTKIIPAYETNLQISDFLWNEINEFNLEWLFIQSISVITNYKVQLHRGSI